MKSVRVLNFVRVLKSVGRQNSVGSEISIGCARSVFYMNEWVGKNTMAGNASARAAHAVRLSRVP